MRIARRFVMAFGMVAPASAALAQGTTAAASTHHRIAMQVSDNDPARMAMALSNLVYVFQHYSGLGHEIEAELVAYGPGLHMLRDDTSPVKARVVSILTSQPGVVFTACGNTMAIMSRAENKGIPLIAGVAVTPAGVVRLTELQEQRWAYIRP